MRRLGAALLVAALACALGLAGLGPGPAAAAKKKGGKGKLTTRTLSSGPLNLAIPDDPDAIFMPAAGVVQTQILAGKRFKGLRIDDVNASLRVSHGDVYDLTAKLTAPNGATTDLVTTGNTFGPSWGSGPPGCGGPFLKVDDEAPLFAADQTPVTEAQLGPPYAGSVTTPRKPLMLMDGGPIRGAWTLTLLDREGPGDIGTLHCWQLQVKPRRVAGLGGG